MRTPEGTILCSHWWLVICQFYLDLCINQIIWIVYTTHLSAFMRAWRAVNPTLIWDLPELQNQAQSRSTKCMPGPVAMCMYQIVYICHTCLRITRHTGRDRSLWACQPSAVGLECPDRTPVWNVHNSSPLAPNAHSSLFGMFVSRSILNSNSHLLSLLQHFCQSYKHFMELHAGCWEEKQPLSAAQNILVDNNRAWWELNLMEEST